ncbi:hypothetical protein Tco_0853840 [Tanacetum coccineum]
MIRSTPSQSIPSNKATATIMSQQRVKKKRRIALKIPILTLSYPAWTKGDDGDVMFIEMVKKNDDSCKEEPEAGGLEVEYYDIFPTRSELAYHKYLMWSAPIPRLFLRKIPFITEGCPSKLKIPCNIRHVKLDPRENSDRGVRNFTGRIKEMHVFVGNFTYVMDFMIVEDISSIIDPRLSQVVLGKTFWIYPT